MRALLLMGLIEVVKLVKPKIKQNILIKKIEKLLNSKF